MKLSKHLGKFIKFKRIYLSTFKIRRLIANECVCFFSRLTYSMSESADDRHPEKRLKAAFKAYEAENLPRIRAENPSMRLTQWKQILFKEWTKSSQNPLNQAI